MNTKYQALDLMKCIQGKYEHKIPGSGFNEMYPRKV